MSYYDEDILTAIELISEFGTEAKVFQLESVEPTTPNTYAVMIPTSTGDSTGSNDRYGSSDDGGQSVNNTRILLAYDPMPVVKKDYTIRVGDQDYQIDAFTLVRPDFTSKVYYDCTCYES